MKINIWKNYNCFYQSMILNKWMHEWTNDDIETNIMENSILYISSYCQPSEFISWSFIKLPQIRLLKFSFIDVIVVH